MPPQDARPVSIRWQCLTSEIDTRQRWAAVCAEIVRRQNLPPAPPVPPAAATATDPLPLTPP